MTLKTHALSSLDEVRAFLDGNAPVQFIAPVGAARYRWLEDTLCQFRYDALQRADKGLLQGFRLQGTHTRGQISVRDSGRRRSDALARQLWPNQCVHVAGCQRMRQVTTLAACRTLVGQAANPSVRSIFPPLLGP